MARIQIPASQSKLAALVEHCLFSLQAQGFDIDEVALAQVQRHGSSTTPWIELVQNYSTTVMASDLLAPLDSNSDYSFALCYYANLSPEACAKKLDKAIFIGITDKQKFDEKGNPTQLDIWRHSVPDTSSGTASNGTVSNAENQSSNEVRAIASKLNLNFNPELHLAWFIALSAIDFPIEDALTLARAITTQLSNVSRETSAEQNPNRDRLALSACQFGDFPTPLLEDKRLGIDVGWSAEGESIHFAHLAKSSLGLYPVVDDVAWIERLLALGIKTIQLRIKDPQQADLEQQIIDAITLGRRYKAQVFINDYWQLAIKHGAFGVHLGQEDIEQANLAQLAKANIHLGLSTHGYYELLRIVQIHPSYIALGHIFATTTKQMPSKPQGLIRLALYQQLIDTIPYDKNAKLGYPTVAIGGIDSSNAAQVWLSGVSSLAVVRAITQAKSPQAVIEFFSELMQTKQNWEWP